jgi:MFS family permease
MFSLAEIVLGGLGAMAGEAHWLLLVWFGGVPPLILGFLIFAAVPDDRGMLGYGEERRKEPGGGEAVDGPGGWAEMLSPRFRRLTLTCVVLAGCNFTGYQLFNEFLTLYLRQERGFDARGVGIAFSLIGVGSLIGGFLWAFVADRFGRKAPLVGFVGVAVAIVTYLVAPASTTVIRSVGFVFGLCLSCAYPWGVYFTEIFPARLRSYGAALFHGGHIISLLAPLLLALVATKFGIVAAMSIAPVIFLIGAGLWATLPETLVTGLYYRGWNPNLAKPSQEMPR